LPRVNNLGAMRLLDRYLFRELLTPMAYCLGGFLIFWISYDLFTELDEMQERKLHLLDVLCYTAARTPEFLVAVLPIGLLLALLYTLTSLARHNEITAMRAAGVSLWRICVPYFAVGLVASAVLIALNEIVVPRSSAWSERILTRYVQKPGDDPGGGKVHDFVNAREHRLWRFGQFNRGAAKMSGPVEVSWKAAEGTKRLLNADFAVRTNGVWTFFKVQEFMQVTGADKRTTLVPLLQTNMLPVPEFDETPREMAIQMKIRSYSNNHSGRRADIPLADIFNDLRLEPDMSGTEASSLLTKLHGRLAAPWTCLVVVLIAIPFGAPSGRRNLFFGVAGSIFICFGYFVVQQIAFAVGQGGHVPAWLAAWLPNLIFGAAGIVLMTRVR
jgi:lipopolysaccharide export system permease protein